MKIVIAGSSGLIGAALARQLRRDGHDVVRLVRRDPAGDDEARWDPAAGTLDGAALAGADGVVHLGGAGIAAKRWSAARKAEIRDSRVNSARLLSETMARLDTPPAVFVCASALGYYGSRDDEVLTESSAQGDDFLAQITGEWEAATQPAAQAGIRVVNLRIGIVLSASGDMPKSMLTPFKLGLGGKLGDGKQYMSWVHIDDVVSAAIHALKTPALQGAVNLAAPNPVTNAEFTKTLGHILGRPALFSVPRMALRVMLGEMSEFVLSSARLQPHKLTESGFRFRWHTIEEALRDVLGKP